MSLPTTSVGMPGSTLALSTRSATAPTKPTAPTAPTPAPLPAAGPTVTKRTVRPKSAALTATLSATTQTVTLVDGRTLAAIAGDWLIARGRQLVDVVSEAQLSARYTIDEPNACVLPAATCAQLEQTTGIGSTRTPADLVKAVERLAKIEVGGIRIDFTPGQLDEIAHRAKKRGRTIQQELQAVVDRIREELFWRS